MILQAGDPIGMTPILPTFFQRLIAIPCRPLEARHNLARFAALGDRIDALADLLTQHHRRVAGFEQRDIPCRP